MSFSYVAACSVEDQWEDEQGIGQEQQAVELSGVVQGLLPAKTTTSTAAGGAGSGEPQTELVVLAADGPAVEEKLYVTRNLLMQI